MNALRWRLVTLVAAMTAACAAEGEPEPAAEGEAAVVAHGAPLDGYVSRAEVCFGYGDAFPQGLNYYRPFGGVLRVPRNLTNEQRAAVEAAALARFVDSGGKAVWRVVPDDQADQDLETLGAPTREDSVVFAPCAPGSQGSAFYWAQPKAVGTVAIVWQGFAPTDWAFRIAGALRVVEGVGVGVPN